MSNKIVLDLETQNEFAEVGGRNNQHLLKVSLVGVYLYDQDKFLTFEEHELDKLEELLKNTKLLIGYNIKNFDLPVLKPYLKLDVLRIPTFDIMENLANIVGHRMSLDSLAKANLGEQKSGSGLEAISLFRNGKMEELKKYCLDDVRLTRDIYEYGLKNKKIKHISYEDGGIREIDVLWDDKSILEQRPQNIISRRIAEAFDKKLVIEINYISNDDSSSVKFRKLEVYNVHDNIFEAYCHQKKNICHFQINKVLDIKILEESYSLPQNFKSQPSFF